MQARNFTSLEMAANANFVNNNHSFGSKRNHNNEIHHEDAITSSGSQYLRGQFMETSLFQDFMESVSSSHYSHSTTTMATSATPPRHIHTPAHLQLPHSTTSSGDNLSDTGDDISCSPFPADNSSCTSSDEIPHSPPLPLHHQSSSLKLKHKRQRSYRKRKSAAHRMQQRHAANMRERKRMQSINEAFEGLRQHIPTLPYEKRLSKVDTLRLTIGYINFLAEMVDKDKNGSSASSAQPRIVPQPRKVIVHSAKGAYQMSHSLSWSSDKENTFGIYANKVWTPEDPRSVGGKSDQFSE